MEPLATLTDLEHRVDWALDEDEKRLAESRAGGRVRPGSALRPRAGPPTRCRVWSRTLVLAACVRYLRNPDGYTQSRAGDETLAWDGQGRERRLGPLHRRRDRAAARAGRYASDGVLGADHRVGADPQTGSRPGAASRAGRSRSRSTRTRRSPGERAARRGQTARIWKTEAGHRQARQQRRRGRRGRPARDPSRCSSRSAPREPRCPVSSRSTSMRMLVTADLADVTLWSRVEWRHASGTSCRPPAYHHGTRTHPALVHRHSAAPLMARRSIRGESAGVNIEHVHRRQRRCAGRAGSPHVRDGRPRRSAAHRAPRRRARRDRHRTRRRGLVRGPFRRTRPEGGPVHRVRPRGRRERPRPASGGARWTGLFILHRATQPAQEAQAAR